MSLKLNSIKLSLLFLLTSSIVYGQSILNPQNNIDWGNYDNSETTKLELLRKINASIAKPVDHMLGGRQATLSNYHVTDITKDGMLDLIYSGPFSEGNAVVIYENRGDEFIASDVIQGELIGFNRLKLSETIEIQTHAFPCCASITHTIKTVVIHSAQNALNLITLAEDVYIRDTEEPVNRMNPIYFETVNEAYKLRSKPEILTDYDRWPETIDGSNTLAIYPKGSRGKAIGKSVDTTGREWWFVIMENNINPINSLLYYNNDPRGTRSYGWMSSRYVKRIDD